MIDGDILLLKGITLQGKNKVREHGSGWKVLSLDKPSCMRYQQAALIESITDQNLRWILCVADKHFTVEVMKDES